MPLTSCIMWDASFDCITHPALAIETLVWEGWCSRMCCHGRWRRGMKILIKLDTKLVCRQFIEIPMDLPHLWAVVRNNASHHVIWHFSLGSTWHELAAPLWVLSAAIPIWGAAFLHNACHAHTLPALHDVCAFPCLKHPIAPAIQKHPSTVHQAL